MRFLQKLQARFQSGLDTLFRVIASILREPLQRILAALVLSALIHALILWMPYLHLPSFKGPMSSLTVRFEYQPKPPSPEAPAPQAVIQVSNVENQVLVPAVIQSAEPVKTVVRKAMPMSAEEHSLPKHVRLSFDVYQGKNLNGAGELQHQLDINAGSYSLKSVRRAAGLLGKAQITQLSRGEFNERGLQPIDFFEESNSSAGKQESKTTFDRATQKIHFPTGAEADLPVDIQDSLSFKYQLSQLSMHTEIIPLAVSDRAHLLDYQIEIGREEKLSTPMGELRVLHLRKMHVEREPYFEIWLGLDYRLLPVKFRQLDSAGVPTEEFVINDIRSSDY